MSYRCKACHAAQMRAHYSTPAYRAKNAERQRQRLSDPIEAVKHAARVTLGNAVKAGQVERKIWCEDCGILGPTHGHHEDYEKPLEVVWLCRRCHSKRHGGYAKKALGALLAAFLLWASPASAATHPTPAELECVRVLTRLPVPKVVPVVERQHSFAVKMGELAKGFGASGEKAAFVQDAVSRGWCR